MALVGGFDAVLAAQTAECLHGNPEGVARVLVTPVQAGHALDLVERCFRIVISSAPISEKGPRTKKTTSPGA